MDFDAAQRALEALQVQCPRQQQREIAVWISAITRAREVLLELQVAEDKRTSPTRFPADPETNRRLAFQDVANHLDVQTATLHRSGTT